MPSFTDDRCSIGVQSAALDDEVSSITTLTQYSTATQCEDNQSCVHVPARVTRRRLFAPKPWLNAPGVAEEWTCRQETATKWTVVLDYGERRGHLTDE